MAALLSSRQSNFSLPGTPEQLLGASANIISGSVDKLLVIAHGIIKTAGTSATKLVKTGARGG